MKLAHKYFGPFQVVSRVGKVAYHLALPSNSQVHPVFHVSLLKKKLGTHSTATTTLPKVGNEGQLLVYPAKILQRWTVKRNNAVMVQWLIQWTHSILEDATWEDSTVIRAQYPDFDPLGQVSTYAGSIVTGQTSVPVGSVHFNLLKSINDTTSF